MLLAELVCLSNQAQAHNGTILAGGRLYVYYKGRTTLATTYSDPAGNVENANPIILDSMGRCSVYASANFSYTLVWCDMYGREMFSYDRDMLDPVPVEDTYSIGIKGDDTIQVKQSTSGQTVVFNLHAKGEDYGGIEPIVVNTATREISANHKPLGVEAPLTFMQDDEEATIIGFDDSTLPPIIEPMVKSAISGKQDILSAGRFIDISNNVIGVIGVQPAGSYATAQDFANLSGYINAHEEAWTSANEYTAGNGIDITNNVIAAKTVPAIGRLTLPLNGTGTISYGDWTFAFSVHSIQAAVVNVRNEKATAADIFSETRTYGHTVRLVGQDLSSGKDIVYCGNGDFQTIPARIDMDIRTESEWIELRLMQFTSGSNLVIDYRIGGTNG